MVISGHKTLLIRCSSCGKIVEYDLNLFNISREIISEFKCTCGETNALLKTVDHKKYYLGIKCFVCGQRHFYRLNTRELFCEDHLYRCIGNIKTCFIGSSEGAKFLLNTKNISLDDLISDKEYKDKFNNLDIVIACLDKLKSLDERGKISCECGNKNMTLEFFSDRIELKCSDCNSVQIIFAETEEDLNVLKRKEKIHLQVHNISFLDSLFEKNKDIKG